MDIYQYTGRGLSRRDIEYEKGGNPSPESCKPGRFERNSFLNFSVLIGSPPQLHTLQGNWNVSAQLKLDTYVCVTIDTIVKCCMRSCSQFINIELPL